MKNFNYLRVLIKIRFLVGGRGSQKNNIEGGGWGGALPKKGELEQFAN